MPGLYIQCDRCKSATLSYATVTRGDARRYPPGDRSTNAAKYLRMRAIQAGWRCVPDFDSNGEPRHDVGYGEDYCPGCVADILDSEESNDPPSPNLIGGAELASPAHEAQPGAIPQPYRTADIRSGYVRVVSEEPTGFGTLVWDES